MRLNNFITIDNPNISPAAKPMASLGQRMDVAGGKASLDHPNEMAVNLRLSDLYLPNTAVRTIRGYFEHNAVFLNQRNEGTHLIGSCLFIEGNVLTTLLGHSKGIVLKKGMQTMKYDPNNEYAHWCKANTPFNIVHFSIEPHFLLAMLPEDEKWAVEVRERIEKRQRIIGESPTMITAPQYSGLQNIFNCPLSGKLGLVMMETSIIQILLLQMHAQFKKNETKQPKVSKRDADTMHAVKAHIEKTFLEDHSMTALSKCFAINTNKLMSLFKKMFGLSIFGYINDLRMEYARQLLADGMFVTEVARIIGYKNPHHFSAAFKKKFGTCPSQLKC